MRTRRLGVQGSVMALLLAGVGACAAGSRLIEYSPGEPARTKAERSAAMTHWKEVRDSVAAQELAESDGPRVSVRVTLDGSSGTRRVDATFRMYDDAYVLVGHLGADGRVRVVFPTSPDDDGFVKGDKIYHVPSFFGGFTDEYRWRRTTDSYHTQQSRLASYDGGVGYVFVIASWRPMRFDRMTDAGKWETYEISDVRYMADPREAIDELASVLAGDNREAYTIEYASYTKTNYGAFSTASLWSLNRCSAIAPFGLSAWGIGPFSYGWGSPMGFGFSPYGFSNSYDVGLGGCGDAYSRYSYAYVRPGYGSPFYPVVRPPVTPGNPGPPPTIPSRPREPGDSVGNPAEPGTDPLAPIRRPRSQPADETPQENQSGGGYRRRGLIAEDAQDGKDRRGSIPREGRQRPTTAFDESGQTRPSIQEMLTRRRNEEAAGRDARSGGGFRDNGDRSGQAFGGGVPSETYRGRPARGHSDDGAASQPRSSGTPRQSGGESGYQPQRGQERSAPRSEPRSEPRGEPRSAPQPAPARSEPRAQPQASSPPPAPPPRAAPAAPAGERKPHGG